MDVKRPDGEPRETLPTSRVCGNLDEPLPEPTQTRLALMAFLRAAFTSRAIKSVSEKQPKLVFICHPLIASQSIRAAQI